MALPKDSALVDEQYYILDQVPVKACTSAGKLRSIERELKKQDEESKRQPRSDANGPNFHVEDV